MKKRFRERNLTAIAAITIVGTVLALIASFQLAKLPMIAGETYTAQFAEGGGLKKGDPVEVAGVEVGKITGLELEETYVKATFTAKDVDLGKDSTAAIKTGTLLGSRFVELQPKGDGVLKADLIPLERTKAPYDLTDSLSQVAAETRELDVDKISEAMDVFSETIDVSSEEIAPAIQGISDLSATIASRDAQLQQLFAAAENVTGTFRERTDQIRNLVQQGNLLLAELQARRTAIERLLTSATGVANQVIALVEENGDSLRPTLTELNEVLALLRENDDNITVAIDRASDFLGGFGEGLGHGTWFNGHLGLNVGMASLQSFVPSLGGGAGLIENVTGGAQ